MVPVGRSGVGGGGSGCSRGCLPFRGLEGLCSISGMNVPGSNRLLCSIKGAPGGV